MKAQYHSCINLSTSDEIDRITKEITSMQKKADEYAQHEKDTISKTGQSTIQTIFDDTRRIQQNLLVYGKRRQRKHETLYNEYLQKYIAALNQWKSKQLADLQREMDQYEERILSVSWNRITGVNDEMNTLRDEVMQATAEKLTKETIKLTAKLQSRSGHHLGTETRTKIELIIHGNVGNKLPGQHCTFDRTSGGSH